MQKSQPVLLFSQGKAEELLARSLGLAERDRAALAGSIKYFRRQGFPKIPERGKRASFTIEKIFELRIALELSELNLPPRVATEAAIIAAKGAKKVTSGSNYALLLPRKSRPIVVPIDDAVSHIKSGRAATVVPLFEIVASFVNALEQASVHDEFFEELRRASQTVEERIISERRS